MKNNNNMQIFGAVVASLIMVFSAGFYSSTLVTAKSQSAQLIKSSAQRVVTPSTNPISNITSPAAIQSNPAWRMLRVGNDFMVKLPSESLPAIANFCQDLATALPPGVDVNKIGAFNADGKYQCNDGSGLCGDGTREGCRRSGCCGGCPNGIYPPGVTSPDQLPNVVFIPDTIMRAIRNNVNQ